MIQPMPMQKEQIAATQQKIAMLNAFAVQSQLQQQANLGKVSVPQKSLIMERFQNVHLYAKEKEKNMLSRKRKFPSSKNADKDLVEAQRKLQEAQNKLLEMQTKRKAVHLSFGPSAVTSSIKSNTNSVQGKRSEMQTKRREMPVPQARLTLGTSVVMNSVKANNNTPVTTGKSNAEPSKEATKTSHRPFQQPNALNRTRQTNMKTTDNDDDMKQKPGLPTSSSVMNTQSVEVQLSPRHTSRTLKSQSNDVKKNNNTPQVIPHNVHVSHHDHMIHSSSDSSHDGALRSTSTNMGQQYSIMI